MAKPFTSYALTRDTYGPYRVLGVVSEARRILYGRRLDGDAVTSVAERNVVLRYDNADQAKAAVSRVEATYRDWAPRIEAARRAEEKARSDRDAAVLAAARPLEGTQ